MRFDVCFVRELRRQKDVGFSLGQLFSHMNAAEKSSLVASDGNNLRAQTFDQRDAFLTHPIGHEDYDLMTQRTTDRRERDAGVAAGRLGYGIAGLNAVFLITLFENVKCHPV